MKKNVLSVAAILTFAVASLAQSPCNFGYFPGSNYAADDFSKKASYDNVYWWNQALTGGKMAVAVDSECVDYTQHLIYSFERTGNGVQTLTLSQPYSKYEPVGVGFGNIDNDTNKTTKVLDLSGGNLKVRVRVKNLGTAQGPKTLNFRIGLQDSSKNLLNAVGLSPLGTFYNDEVKFDLADGQTIDTTIDFNTNAYEAVYSKDACDAGTPALKDVDFNPKAVAAVTFTIINALNAGGDDGYKPYRLVDAKVEFQAFVVGTPCILGLSEEEQAALTAGKFRVYPNPATSGKVTFTSAAQNVKVSDVLGNVVFSAPTASEIDVTGFNKGVYVVQSSKGATRFVVE